MDMALIISPSTLGWAGLSAGAVWIGGLAAAWALEPRLVFGRPSILRSAPPGPHAHRHRVQNLRLSVSPGIGLHGLLACPVDEALARQGTGPRLTVLWFGGRNEDIRWTPALAGWLGPHAAVASFAYRGLLGGGGRPCEANVVSDAIRIVRNLMADPRLADTRLVLAGRSLGSAVAMQVAARLPAEQAPAGVVLLSPMDSVRGLAAKRHWLRPALWAMRCPFDSLAVARQLQAPVLMLLAADDEQVPHWRSLRLASAIQAGRPKGAPEVQMRIVAGTNHKTLARAEGALDAMATFVNAIEA